MVVKEIEKTSIVKVYVASDGMEFPTEFACKNHEIEIERNDRNKALKASDEIPHCAFDSIDISEIRDECARLYYIRNKDDLNTLNSLFDTSAENFGFHLDEDCIGTLQIITEAEYEDYTNSYLVGSFDEWKDRVITFINNIYESVMKQVD